MIRTQIYIDENNKKAIEKFCTYTGRSQSEIIREAISFYIKNEILTSSDSAFGIWIDNDYDNQLVRKSFDRTYDK